MPEVEADGAGESDGGSGDTVPDRAGDGRDIKLVVVLPK